MAYGLRRSISRHIPKGRRMIAEARDYRELWAAFRARADQLAMTREDIDADTGLPSGYASTLLAPAQVKKMGLSSLGALLAVLKLKIIIVEDGSSLTHVH